MLQFNSIYRLPFGTWTLSFILVFNLLCNVAELLIMNYLAPVFRSTFGWTDPPSTLRAYPSVKTKRLISLTTHWLQQLRIYITCPSNCNLGKVFEGCHWQILQLLLVIEWFVQELQNQWTIFALQLVTKTCEGKSGVQELLIFQCAEVQSSCSKYCNSVKSWIIWKQPSKFWCSKHCNFFFSASWHALDIYLQTHKKLQYPRFISCLCADNIAEVNTFVKFRNLSVRVICGSKFYCP